MRYQLEANTLARYGRYKNRHLAGGTSFLTAAGVIEENLELWIDPRDTDTYTTDGSNRVTAMTDKSPNAYTATIPATDAWKPTLVSGALLYTDLQYIQFGAEGDWDFLSDFDNEGATTYAVIELTTGNTNDIRCVYTNRQSGLANGMELQFDDQDGNSRTNNLTWRVRNSTFTLITTTSMDSVFTDEKCLLTFRLGTETGEPTSTAYKNAYEVFSVDASGASPTSGTNVLTLGNDPGENKSIKGKIHEILIYRGKHTLAQKRQIEAYLNNKHTIYQTTPTKLYTLQGQSNASGRGNTTDAQAATLGGQSNVIINSAQNAATGTYYLGHPTASQTWGASHTNLTTLGKLGIELTLGQELITQTGDDIVAILKNSEGDTGFENGGAEWADGGSRRDYFISMYAEMIAYGIAMGRPFSYEGTVWLQGHADAGQTAWAEAYGDNEAELKAVIESTTGVTDKKFITAEIKVGTDTTPFYPDWEEVNIQKAAHAAADSDVTLIANTGFTLENQDPEVHLDAPTLEALGVTAGGELTS